MLSGYQRPQRYRVMGPMSSHGVVPRPDQSIHCGKPSPPKDRVQSPLSAASARGDATPGTASHDPCITAATGFLQSFHASFTEGFRPRGGPPNSTADGK